MLPVMQLPLISLLLLLMLKGMEDVTPKLLLSATYVPADSGKSGKSAVCLCDTCLPLELWLVKLIGSDRLLSTDNERNGGDAGS